MKSAYYFELFTLETIILLGSDESKITNDKNYKNMTQLAITKVILLVVNAYQQD